MRARRALRLLIVILALTLLGWLLLPGAQVLQVDLPTRYPGPTQHQGDARTGAAAAGDRNGAVPAEPGRQVATLPAFLPPEAVPVIGRIQRGEPFTHRQDGSVFGNRERRLPRHEHGYYREYTVPTPGLSHRGARRIVTGGDPPREWYYTDDHYDSFRPFQAAPMQAAPSQATQ